MKRTLLTIGTSLLTTVVTILLLKEQLRGERGPQGLPGPKGDKAYIYYPRYPEPFNTKPTVWYNSK